MGDKYSPQHASKDDLDGSFGENPGYPGRKRPSDWGAGNELRRPVPDAKPSPASKAMPTGRDSSSG
jgi:hypothetical protein